MDRFHLESWKLLALLCSNWVCGFHFKNINQACSASLWQPRNTKIFLPVGFQRGLIILLCSSDWKLWIPILLAVSSTQINPSLVLPSFFRACFSLPCRPLLCMFLTSRKEKKPNRRRVKHLLYGGLQIPAIINADGNLFLLLVEMLICKWRQGFCNLYSFLM